MGRIIGNAAGKAAEDAEGGGLTSVDRVPAPAWAVIAAVDSSVRDKMKNPVVANTTSSARNALSCSYTQIISCIDHTQRRTAPVKRSATYRKGIVPTQLPLLEW